MVGLSLGLLEEKSNCGEHAIQYKYDTWWRLETQGFCKGFQHGRLFFNSGQSKREQRNKHMKMFGEP